MCFYNDDCDWYADVQDVEIRIADKPTKCDECDAEISVGESFTHIFQQEHEECTVCEQEEAEEPCEEHDYGETYEHEYCETCRKILAVIELMETEEGCPPDSRLPMFGELQTVFWGSEYEHEREKYVKRIREIHPELIGHKWIGKAD